MHLCLKCKSEISFKDKFCTVCGAEITQKNLKSKDSSIPLSISLVILALIWGFTLTYFASVLNDLIPWSNFSNFVLDQMLLFLALIILSFVLYFIIGTLNIKIPSKMTLVNTYANVLAILTGSFLITDIFYLTKSPNIILAKIFLDIDVSILAIIFFYMVIFSFINNREFISKTSSDSLNKKMYINRLAIIVGIISGFINFTTILYEESIYYDNFINSHQNYFSNFFPLIGILFILIFIIVVIYVYKNGIQNLTIWNLIWKMYFFTVIGFILFPAISLLGENYLNNLLITNGIWIIIFMLITPDSIAFRSNLKLYGPNHVSKYHGLLVLSLVWGFSLTYVATVLNNLFNQYYFNDYILDQILIFLELTLASVILYFIFITLNIKIPQKLSLNTIFVTFCFILIGSGLASEYFLSSFAPESFFSNGFFDIYFSILTTIFLFITIFVVTDKDSLSSVFPINLQNENRYISYFAIVIGFISGLTNFLIVLLEEGIISIEYINLHPNLALNLFSLIELLFLLLIIELIFFVYKNDFQTFNIWAMIWKIYIFILIGFITGLSISLIGQKNLGSFLLSNGILLAIFSMISSFYLIALILFFFLSFNYSGFSPTNSN